jgi:ketosteroid isomerase-like protein
MTMSTQTRPEVEVEVEVRAVLDEYAAAHAARDVERMLAPYSPGAVRYSLAPPLQQAPGTMVGDAEGLRKWLAGFAGPVLIERRDLTVEVDGTVAFAYALSRMTATPAGAPEPFSFWFRSTFGLRCIDGEWRIVHVHDSTPFHMDGSFRAAVDLEP